MQKLCYSGSLFQADIYACSAALEGEGGSSSLTQCPFSGPFYLFLIHSSPLKGSLLASSARMSACFLSCERRIQMKLHQFLGNTDSGGENIVVGFGVFLTDPYTMSRLR